MSSSRSIARGSRRHSPRKWPMSAAGRPASSRSIPAKSRRRRGGRPPDFDPLVAPCRDIHKLPVVGLMCIPPVDEEPALHFALLGKIAARNGLPKISMGMSADYEMAVKLGATHVRVGSALFGARPPLETAAPETHA